MATCSPPRNAAHCCAEASAWLHAGAARGGIIAISNAGGTSLACLLYRQGRAAADDPSPRLEIHRLHRIEFGRQFHTLEVCLAVMHRLASCCGCRSITILNHADSEPGFEKGMRRLGSSYGFAEVPEGWRFDDQAGHPIPGDDVCQRGSKPA